MMILRKIVKFARPTVSLHQIHNTRTFSLQVIKNSDKYSLPALMEFPNLVSPSPKHTLRNWMLSRTLITPYFDNEFNITQFDAGAHYAAANVTNSLATGDLGNLDHLVTPDTLSLVKKNLR